MGRGSRFIVDLPFALVEAVTPAPGPTASEQADKETSDVRLLLVEDNVVNQRVVLAMLRKRQFSVDVASNGRQALDMLEDAAEPYHLVLMDVQMPVLDGMETTRLIRRDARWKNLPVLALTAHAMTGDRERCLDAGMNGYISKPVQTSQLLAAIDKTLAAQNVVEESLPELAALSG